MHVYQFNTNAPVSFYTKNGEGYIEVEVGKLHTALYRLGLKLGKAGEFNGLQIVLVRRWVVKK